MTLKDNHAFSGFSVTSLSDAQAFYGEKLGLKVSSGAMGLQILANGTTVFLYEKKNHVPATFTVLNFVVSNIDESVDELVKQGISIEKYPGMNQDDKGIARGLKVKRGPDIAWFKDPSGNIISVLQDK